MKQNKLRTGIMLFFALFLVLAVTAGTTLAGEEGPDGDGERSEEWLGSFKVQECGAEVSASNEEFPSNNPEVDVEFRSEMGTVVLEDVENALHTEPLRATLPTEWIGLTVNVYVVYPEGGRYSFNWDDVEVECPPPLCPNGEPSRLSEPSDINQSESDNIIWDQDHSLWKVDNEWLPGVMVFPGEVYAMSFEAHDFDTYPDQPTKVEAFRGDELVFYAEPITDNHGHVSVPMGMIIDRIVVNPGEHLPNLQSASLEDPDSTNFQLFLCDGDQREEPSCIGTTVTPEVVELHDIINITTEFDDPDGVVDHVRQEITETAEDGAVSISMLEGTTVDYEANVVGTGSVVSYLLDAAGVVVGGGPEVCEDGYVVKAPPPTCETHPEKCIAYMPIVGGSAEVISPWVDWWIVFGDPHCADGSEIHEGSLESYLAGDHDWCDCGWGEEPDVLLYEIPGFELRTDLGPWGSDGSIMETLTINGEQVVVETKDWEEIEDIGVSSEVARLWASKGQCSQRDCWGFHLVVRRNDEATGRLVEEGESLNSLSADLMVNQPPAPGEKLTVEEVWSLRLD